MFEFGFGSGSSGVRIEFGSDMSRVQIELGSIDINQYFFFYKRLYFLVFQAKNEQDPSAISALMQALKLDPGNKEAIIALAASLTNESMQSQACYALQGIQCILTYLYNLFWIMRPTTQIVRCDIQKRYLNSTLHHNTAGVTVPNQIIQAVRFCQSFVGNIAIRLPRNFVVNCIEPTANHI